MNYRRRLPGPDVLLKHIKTGLTNKQIADLYGVSPEAVRQAVNREAVQRELEREGIERGPKRVSHRRYMPWRIRADHAHDIVAKRLRLYSRAEQGLPLADAERRQLVEWKEYMDGGNRWRVPLSVHYEISEGFWLAPRQAGDENYISPPSA